MEVRLYGNRKINLRVFFIVTFLFLCACSKKINAADEKFITLEYLRYEMTSLPSLASLEYLKEHPSFCPIREDLTLILFLNDKGVVTSKGDALLGYLKLSLCQNLNGQEEKSNQTAYRVIAMADLLGDIKPNVEGTASYVERIALSHLSGSGERVDRAWSLKSMIAKNYMPYGVKNTEKSHFMARSTAYVDLYVKSFNAAKSKGK